MGSDGIQCILDCKGSQSFCCVKEDISVDTHIWLNPSNLETIRLVDFSEYLSSVVEVSQALLVPELGREELVIVYIISLYD